MPTGAQNDPFRDLTNLPSLSGGETIRIERGSSFQSEARLGGTDNVTVEAYGGGSLPLIDCSEEIPDSGWSLATSQSNTYEQSLSAASSAVFSARIWEDGTELTKQSSISDVESNPGSYYVDTSSDPWVYYLHPQGSTDPSSDGKLYETNRREYAVENVNFGEGEVATTVQGVRARRPLHNDGAVVLDAVSEIKQCILEEGGKHHSVFGGGTVRDSFFVNAAPSRNSLNHSSLQFFKGSGTPDGQPAKTRRCIFIDTPKIVDTRNHSGFNAADHQYLVAWECGVGASMQKDAAVVDGGYLKDVSSPFLANGLTLRRQLIDSLGWPQGNSLIEKSATIEDSVILAARLKRSTQTTGETVTIKNSLIITGSSRLVKDISSNNPNVDIQKCVIVTLGKTLASDSTLTGDDCIFVSGTEGVEVYARDVKESLSSLQSGTGAFSNSVWCSLSQWRDLLQGDWRKGDARINSNADVTQADGTVLTGKLPDGTPITDLGPQTHPDFATQSSVGGAPSQWPTPPITKSERENNVEDLDSWNWQGTPPDHRTEVSLGDRLEAFWKMDGASGEDEPDSINSNTFTQYNSPGAGSTSNFPYRTYDNNSSQRHEVGTVGAELQDPFRLWIAFPLRPSQLSNDFPVLFGWSDTNSGIEVTASGSGELSFLVDNRGSGITDVVSATAGSFNIVQMWNDPEQGQTGIRVNGTEKVLDSAYGQGIDDDSTVLALASKPGGNKYSTCAYGPIMWASVVPSQADRDWLYNSGSYRTLSEIQNRTVTVKDI